MTSDCMMAAPMPGKTAGGNLAAGRAANQHATRACGKAASGV
jgi:hypothetical protein